MGTNSRNISTPETDRRNSIKITTTAQAPCAFGIFIASNGALKAFLKQAESAALKTVST